ncbi:hypothetical protein [Streptomyces colonosanans]|nr:hypothetical protein [Streptomyces colonosanans]
MTMIMVAAAVLLVPARAGATATALPDTSIAVNGPHPPSVEPTAR